MPGENSEPCTPPVVYAGSEPSPMMPPTDDQPPTERGDKVPYGTTPSNAAGAGQRQAADLRSDSTTIDDDKPQPRHRDGGGKTTEAVLGVGLLLSIVAVVCLAVAVAAVAERDDNGKSTTGGGSGGSSFSGRAIPPNNWAQITPAGASPPPRLAHAAASVANRYLYVHGGLYGSGNQSLSDLWRYDERNDEWDHIATTGDAPSARLHHSLVSVDDTRLVLFGGFNYFNTQPQHTGLGDMYSLDLATFVWTRLDTTAGGAARPTPRGAHDAVVVGSYMWVFGGFERIGVTDHHEELWRWDTVAHTWANMTQAAGPEGRIGFAMADLDDTLYLFGGGCESAGQCNDTLAYNTQTSTWTHRSPPHPAPSARRATHGDIGVYGILYLFGGVHIAVVGGSPQVTMFDDFWAYDPAANKWIELHPNFDRGPRPPKTFGHSVSRIGSRVVVFGGRVGSPASPGSNQLWEYEAMRPTA